MSRAWISLGLPATLSLISLFVLAPASAVAQDDDDLRLMNEPTSYTDVADAFDEEDPFDFNFRLSFSRMRESGPIERQVTAPGGRTDSNFVEVADWEHVRNTLELGMDIGLYKDLALYARLPVVLSDDRQLRASGATAGGNLTTVSEFPSASDPGAPLFNPDFDSPTRSGIDYLGVGLAWAIFNQFRTPDLPTWVIMIEGRFNVSNEMRACEQMADGRRCLQPEADDPMTAAEESLAVRPGGDPGVSRGTNALRLETRTSRRFRYVEPYMGIGFEIEWPGKAEDFFAPAGDLQGFMNTRPPIEGELTAGLSVVPWEERAKWQRFAIDMRVIGTFISEGRDYSPLFDALGTSQSPYLTQPNLEGIPDGSTRLRSVEFNGLTDVQGHGRVGGRFALHMQAARYVWFNVGLGVFYTTPYLLSFADACNPNVNQDNHPALKGRCRNGIINPHHRQVIDLPGNRFRLGGSLTLDFFATATAQF